MTDLNAYRCPECRHPDHEHNVEQVPKMANCSFGWCRCSLLRVQVAETGEPITIKTRPAFDHATGRWAS